MSQSVKQPRNLGTLGMLAWALMALLGGLMITVALGWSDPIESEDWAAAALLLIVVAVPLALSVISSRSKSLVRSASLLAGAIAWPVLLYWIVVYG